MRHFVDLFHLVLLFGSAGRHARLAVCKAGLKVLYKCLILI